MLKIFVMKFHPEKNKHRYKTTILLTIKHIKKFKMSPTKEELIIAIKSQRFRTQIINEINKIYEKI